MLNCGDPEDDCIPTSLAIQILCQPAAIGGKWVRALRPRSPEDAKLLEAIGREEFMVNGFRNRDLRALLFAETEPADTERKRRSAKASRQLRMLGAHGLIQRVTKTHHYQLTNQGRAIIAALRAVDQATPEQLTKRTA